MAFPKYNEIYKKYCDTLRFFDTPDQKLFKKAFEIAKQEHNKQKKFGLWPYIIHPLSVFSFLANKLKITDKDILITALLHDVVEDGNITFTKIKKLFGAKVCKIMKEITRFRPPKETEAEKTINKQKHFQKISSGSPEAKLIKLVDEYDNMRHWQKIPQKNHNRKKFPRWIKEAKRHILLARKINQTLCEIMSKELTKTKQN
jgi:(p)ppGpp synthase/HD superfamily hydrolase